MNGVFLVGYGGPNILTKKCDWMARGNKMVLGKRLHNNPSTATLSVFHVLFLVRKIDCYVNYVMSFTQLRFATGDWNFNDADAFLDGSPLNWKGWALLIWQFESFSTLRISVFPTQQIFRPRKKARLCAGRGLGGKVRGSLGGRQLVEPSRPPLNRMELWTNGLS